jgi:hypothetical protein
MKRGREKERKCEIKRKGKEITERGSKGVK